MKTVVLVKQVPDSGSERRLRDADHAIERESADNLINEMDDYAIEEALRLQEAHGGEVTILTMGPEQAAESIRKALSMGPDQAVHVLDDGLAGSCAVATSAVLAAALRTLSPDLVLCGAESTDGRVQAMPHMIAERLGIAALTGARKLTVASERSSGASDAVGLVASERSSGASDAVGLAAGSTLTVERQTEEGYEVVAATAPAVVSVWDTINEPRYPSFKGIMAAKKKPVSVLSLADLGIDPGEVGAAGATSAVVSHQQRPARSAGQKVVDQGDGGVKLVEFLASEKFV